MFQVNPVFQKTLRPPQSSKKTLPPEQAYSPEDDKLNWEWHNPSEDSVPVKFCLDTSLHGLKYLGQQKRHVFERLFWLAAFVASVITSAVLIYGMWNEYSNMPIVTVFNPTEKTLDAIPFPAVTICNVNGFRKSSFDQVSDVLLSYGKSIIKIIHDDQLLRSLAMLVDMNFICDTSLTFIDRFMGNTTYATILQWFHDNKVAVSENMDEIMPFLDPIGTLRKVSQPCEKMILRCIWLDTVTNCSELFQPIETDYGYCCTFNSIPVSLLLKNITDNRDRPDVVEGWKAANLNYENLIFTEETENRTYPYRQRYPGKSAGLSILLNPEFEEYFCPNTDSEGFMMGINVPLDYPRMKDYGIAIRSNAEIFVAVNPEITMSEETVKSYPLKKRQCYYGNEYPLPHYKIYTTDNCMSECIAANTLKDCDCIRFYMPRDTDTASKLCMPAMYNCTEKVQAHIISTGLSRVCKECLPTCTEIKYHKEVSALRLRTKLLDSLIKEFKETFKARDASIVHVYMNTDSVYPRLRKQLTSMTQLMSNTGGLLGLCMGFSVLSLLEIFYYGTIRLCCSFYRNKTIRDHSAERGADRNQARSIYDDQEAVNPKQGWFSKIFNGASGIKSIDMKRTGNNRKTIEDGYDDDGDVFKVRRNDKLPGYIQGSF